MVAQAVFQGETCIATGDVTMVTLDKETREPIPLPHEVVARLEPWKFKGE